MSVDLEFTAKGRGSATHIKSYSASKSVFKVQQQQQYVYIYGYIYGICLKLFASSVFMELWPDSSRERTAPFPVFFIFTASEWLDFRYLDAAVMY